MISLFHQIRCSLNDSFQTRTYFQNSVKYSFFRWNASPPQAWLLRWGHDGIFAIGSAGANLGMSKGWNGRMFSLDHLQVAKRQSCFLLFVFLSWKWLNSIPKFLLPLVDNKSWMGKIVAMLKRLASWTRPQDPQVTIFSWSVSVAKFQCQKGCSTLLFQLFSTSKNIGLPLLVLRVCIIWNGTF